MGRKYVTELWSEWKINTGVPAFERELQHFAATYPLRWDITDLLRFTVTPIPGDHPSWRIQMRRPPFSNDWHQVSEAMRAWPRKNIYVSHTITIRPDERVTLDVTTLHIVDVSKDTIRLVVEPCLIDGQPFVADFLDWCREIWDATRLGSAIPPVLSASPFGAAAPRPAGDTTEIVHSFTEFLFGNKQTAQADEHTTQSTDDPATLLHPDTLPAFVPRSARKREVYRAKYQIARPMVLTDKARSRIAEAIDVEERTLRKILRFGEWEAALTKDTT